MKFFLGNSGKTRAESLFRLFIRFAAGRNGTLLLAGIFLVWGLSCGGCHHQDAPETETVSDRPVPSFDKSSDVSDSPDDQLEPIPDLRPEELLRDVIDVYHRAKIYSDVGFVKTVYEIDGAPVTYRFPASVTLQKPNFVRMEVAEGILACDGENIWGKILDPFYDNQILKRKAPLLLSSIRELYPDIKLADAMDLPVPPNIFWVPPQLILLLAKEPLKTLTAGADLKLLEPRYLRQDDGKGAESRIPCDRIAVNASDGTRVFWIDRETKGVVRIELPLEQIQAPEGVERVLELSMDFPIQILSDESPSTSDIEPGMFSIPQRARDETVDHFLPPEQTFYGNRAPSVRLSPLISGFSPISLDDPQQHIRVFALWGGAGETPLIWNRSQALLKEMEVAARMFAHNDRIEFYAVNVDPPGRANADILSDYGDMGLSFPLYRINRTDLQKSSIARIAVPSLIFVDSDGIVQKYYSRPISYVTIQFQLVLLSDGKNIFHSDVAAFRSLTGGFEETVRAADENDYYAIKTDMKGEEPKIADPAEPTTFRLEKVWDRQLLDPANPLVIADSFKAEDDAESEESSRPASRNIPDNSLLIPYGGNMIALLDSAGKLLQTKTTAAGEPVSFIRTFKTLKGDRYFAVSSFLDTHKIYLFGDSLNLLGTLDVNEPRQQWVADLLLNDENNDNQPELLMALVGDSASNLIPTHGIYSVPVRTGEAAASDEKCPIQWKDEFVVTPFRLGFARQSDSDEKISKSLLGMSFPVDNMGKLVENSLIDGRRIRSIHPRDDVSILWFTTHFEDADKETPTESLAALIARMEDKVPSFALLDMEGVILKETPLEEATWSEHLERIQPGDVNADGTMEWLVPTREGVIYFFDAAGNLFDRFAAGFEITGVSVAHWKEGVYLIVTHPTGVVAYKIAPPEAAAE